MNNEIFISYSRKDKPFTAKLAEALQGTGRDLWVDWEDIPLTADWWMEIQRGIEGAHTFVFIISPDSVASAVCAREIEHAVQHNKRIIPVVHRDAKEIPGTLTHLNWVFFRETEDFETAFQALLSAIDTDLDWVKAHTRLTVRAVEWESHGRNDSYALRGDDLKQAERRLAQTGKEPKLTGLQVQYIVTSQQSAIRRQRRALAAVAFGLLAASILGCIAFLNFQASRREAGLRLQAEAEAEQAGAARETAVVVQQTAESEAEAAVARAQEAQGQALAAETAQAQALVAEATAEAARANAETDREAAVAAQATAQAARQAAQTQQAQAEQGLTQAVVAQQTAEAAQAEAVAAQQTALAGEALAEASQATAVAGQATAGAQQATAAAGQATAQAQQATAQAAAQEAAQAQAMAEAARQEAEAAKAEAEAAKEEAEAAAKEAEADKATAQTELAGVQSLRATVEAELAQAYELIDEANLARVITKYSLSSCLAEDLYSYAKGAITSEGEYLWIEGGVFPAETHPLYKVRRADCALVGAFDIPSSPADLTYGQGYIWETTLDNQLHKIDPSNMQVESFPLEAGSSSSSSILFAQGYVWVASTVGVEGRIDKIDPNTGQNLRSYPLTQSPIDLIEAEGYIWIRNADFTLSKLQVSSGLTQPIDLPGISEAMIYAQGYLWVSLSNIPGGGYALSQYELDTGRLVKQFPFQFFLTALAFDGVYLWALNPLGQEIVKIRLEDGVVLASIPTEPSPYGSLVFDGAHLWFYHQYSEEFFLGGNLQKIPIRTIPTGQGPGRLVEDGNYIWVANYDSNTVTKIRADTGVPLPPFKIGQSPLDLLLIGDKLWVAGPDMLFKLNRVDGKLLGTFPLSRPDPINLVYDGVNLWAGHRAAISRYRESDGAPAGVKDYPSVPPSEIYLSYDGANVWAVQSQEGKFQKLKADFSPLLTYSINYKQAPVYVDHYFWGIDPFARAAGNTIYFDLYRVDPSNGSQLTISLPTPYEGLGLAYSNDYIWVTSWQVPLSDPSDTNAVKIIGVCNGQYPLYHHATQTVWAACPEDNTIQAIYSLASSEANLSLSPAAPAGGEESLYLPLVIKREGK